MNYSWKKFCKIISTRYNLSKKSIYDQLQPKLDLPEIKKDFDVNEIAFCDNNDVDLSTLEEIQLVEQQYGQQTPDYQIVNDGRRESVVNINEEKEKYQRNVSFSNNNDNINENNNNNVLIPDENAWIFKNFEKNN